MGAAETSNPTAECCIMHTFERAERVCHHCGHWHCDQCLVTPWGPRKPALCVNCALNRGGVRKTTTNAPPRTAKEIRQLEKQSKKREHEDSSKRSISLHRAAPAVAQARGQVDKAPRAGLLGRLRPS